MSAVRRGQEPMKLSLPKPSLPSDLPLISALFLIYFDIKAGYTIGWKRSLPGIELEGVVEYKSLPSGLHNVQEDLIYFVHELYAGLSAFVNAPASEQSRNARMIAVGVLVPLSYGRLGRSWKHAENLKALAQQLVLDESATEALEQYWQSHKAEDNKSAAQLESSIDSPSTIRFKPIRAQPGQTHRHRRNRSASDGAALLPPGHSLSVHHPAWSLSALLDTFGPLIFPVHRAALLRKRILISCHAPVQETCDFVYDLSVLSNIPFAVADLTSPSAPPQRLRPLFTIGVHDIPLLEEDFRASIASTETPPPEDNSEDEAEPPGHGWIACTTDGILADKEDLYDVLITMPPSRSAEGTGKAWPKVESPRGVPMKATQRDLRRYEALRWGLSRVISDSESPSIARSTTVQSGDGLPRPPPWSALTFVPASSVLHTAETDIIVEPLSWSALAYSGFMWWASAGERSIALDEETENDGILLGGLDVDPQKSRQRRKSSSTMTLEAADLTAKREMAIIAYFHRLTTLIMTTVSDIVDATDSDDGAENSPLWDGDNGDGNEGPAVLIRSSHLIRMGLDVWSASDRNFIEDLVNSYFGRRAQVESRNVDICGVRVC